MFSSDRPIMMTMSTFLQRIRPTLRVVTWNIDSRLDARPERLNAIFEILKGIDADVICLQEVWDDADKELAAKLGFTVAASYLSPNHYFPIKNSILTRLNVAFAGIKSAEEYDLTRIGENKNPITLVASTIFSSSGRAWRFSNTHLAWGGFSEGVRLSQVREIEKFAKLAQDKYPDLTQVLVGDFNALPNSSTIRYITGLEPDEGGDSTLWVDAWAKSTDDNGYTSTPSNPLSASVALTQGITEPNFMPERRIDYIFVRGYAHGKPGTPMSVKLLDRGFNGVQPSDHYGVVANLWDPKVN